jgi:hypothetical protein
LTTSRDENLQSTRTQQIGAGGIYLGMTLEEAKALNRNATFRYLPVYEYGMDASYNGLLIEDHTGPLMFLHPDEVSDTIVGISLISPELTIGRDIRTGMTVSEFIERYPNATIEIDAINNSIEIGYVAKETFRVEFLTTDSTRVGKYEIINGDPASRGIQRPDARIDRILI